MSRYTGPAWKVSRRLGFSTLETGRELAKRNYAPGKPKPDRKKKVTEYGKQLQEKQKVRVMYGVNERQFRRLFVIARNSKEVTGTEFLGILESRLDNVVYRLGLARTRRGARQLVNHGHVLVNGNKVDIPSYLVNPGSKISLKESSKSLKIIQEALQVAPTLVPFVTFDKEKLEGVFVRKPERSELNQEIDESLIVEYYNRLV
ncbi:MAG: 30S ribosomal protein S4 [Bacilli bacterium]|nr:30S ribosomal protein S4 [Bacilli bacterium]